jgi:hypothetical protein
MTSEHSPQDRARGVWGARAYAWSGEERPRVAGFPIDQSGHQRVLGFPASPRPPGAGHHGWFRKPARSRPDTAGRRARLVVAVVAVLNSGESKQGRG